MRGQQVGDDTEIRGGRVPRTDIVLARPPPRDRRARLGRGPVKAAVDAPSVASGAGDLDPGTVPDAAARRW
jgi:hypothetical protein